MRHLLASAVLLLAAGPGCSSTPAWSCPAPPADSGEAYVPGCESGKAHAAPIPSGFCAGEAQADADAACQAAIGVLPGTSFTVGSTTYVVEPYQQMDCTSWGVWQGSTLETRLCKAGNCECL